MCHVTIRRPKLKLHNPHLCFIPLLAFSISCLFFALALAIPLLAYDYPLSSQSIRDAWFIGNHKGTSAAAFFEKYTHHFPIPPSGPRIAMVELETPFLQVVERSEQSINFTPLDAESEFLGKPAVFRVRIQIYFTPSYSAIASGKEGNSVTRSDNFWQSFKFKFIQGHEIRPSEIRGHPIYQNGEVGALIGAEVQLLFPASAIQSSPATVEIIAPGGQKTETHFDLASLR